MIEQEKLDEILEFLTDDSNLFDELYHYQDKYIDACGYKVIKIDDGEIMSRSSWENYVIFQIEGDDRLFKANQYANSWDSLGWCDDDPIIEVKAEQVTTTVYVPVA